MIESMKMRAAVLETAGQPLVIRDDVEIIAPRAGEVRVRVHYCGLCHSDYSVVSGVFPFMGPAAWWSRSAPASCTARPATR